MSITTSSKRLAVHHAPGAAEDRQGAHRQRQFAVRLPETEAHRPRVQHVDACDLFELRAEGRLRVPADQGVVAVLHVGRFDRGAVVEARLLAQAEGGAETVGCDLDVFGEQAVARGGLVHGPDQQRVEQQDGEVGRRRPLDGEGVVLVEGGIALVAHQPQFTALGRFGAGVVERRETGRIFQVVPERIAVGGPCSRSAGPGQQ
jgi:hypothetical protein